MDDVTKQPVPGQGVGTPAGTASSAEQSQTAVPQAQEPTGQQGTVEAKPVTAQDLALLEKRLQSMIQSQVDKGESRAIKKAVAETKESIDRLRGIGHTVTEQEADTLLQKAVQKATLEAATAEENIAQESKDPYDLKQWDQADPAVQVVLQAQAEAGLTINRDDPEAKMINRGAGAATWIKSNLSALEAKKARLAQPNVQTSEAKPTTNPAARIPASGSQGSAPAASSKEYWKDAYKK